VPMLNAEEAGAASATEESSASLISIWEEDSARSCSFGSERAQEGDDSVSVEGSQTAEFSC
jgi:hypothetical protein